MTLASELVHRDLPDLETFRNRWAFAAALRAATFGPATGDRDTRAQKHGWFWDDIGGSWAQMILLPNSRALLTGVDRDFSNTIWEDNFDLGRGLPQWAIPYLPAGEDPYCGFAYVYDDGAWWSRDHGVPDGLSRLGLPFRNEQDVIDDAIMWTSSALDDLDEDDPRSLDDFDPKATLRAARLGPDLDERALLDVMLVETLDISAGVAAARAFGGCTPVPDGATDLGYALGQSI